MRRRKIEKIGAATATLSRRAEYLADRLESHRGDEKHRQFDRRELGALRIALDSMQLAQLMQRPESDPIALLEEVDDAVQLFRERHTNEGADGFDEQEKAEALGNLLEVIARCRSTVALADAYLSPGDEDSPAGPVPM